MAGLYAPFSGHVNPPKGLGIRGYLPKTRSRADKEPGVLRLPCKCVEAKSAVNYGMCDLRLYCPSTLSLHGCTRQISFCYLNLHSSFFVYFYREMIPPNEGMHVPDQLLIPCTYRAASPCRWTPTSTALQGLAHAAACT